MGFGFNQSFGVGGANFGPFSDSLGSNSLGTVPGTSQVGQGSGSSWWRDAAKDIGGRVIDGVLDRTFGSKDGQESPTSHDSRISTTPGGDVDGGGRATTWFSNQEPSNQGANTTAGGISPTLILLLGGLFLLARRA